MAQQIDSTKAADAAGAESRGSSAPLLAADASSLDRSQASTDPDSAGPAGEGENATKPRKRDFWKFGKKTEDEPSKSKAKSPILASIAPRTPAAQNAPIAALRSVSPLHSPDGLRASASPQRSHPYGVPSSPGQGVFASSPRMHSPASSQIFERNVQEDVLPPQASPQIPSHILTENHIPPALDASSAAITNTKLDPDDVEIVTHATHQPASVTITGAEHLHDDALSHSQRYDVDNASNYATLDNADVRRLSFISFADVVHAEQVDHDTMGMGSDSLHTRRESAQPGASLVAPRSPSPLRSPVSSHGLGTSPPSSVSPSFKGLEASPSRRGPGSPPPGQMSPLGGELNIETMRQALRKTGSGDLSGHRSLPLSAVGAEDGTFHDKPFK